MQAVLSSPSPLVRTSACVTAATVGWLVASRLLEVPTEAEGVYERLVRDSDAYYSEAKDEPDPMRRLQFMSMSLSLLDAVRSMAPRDVVERVGGYDGGRRVKRIQQEIVRLSSDAAAPPPVPNA